MKVKVTKIKENKDGSATVYLEYDKEVENLIKKETGKKKLTKKICQDFFLEAFKRSIKNHSNKS